MNFSFKIRSSKFVPMVGINLATRLPQSSPCRPLVFRLTAKSGRRRLWLVQADRKVRTATVLAWSSKSKCFKLQVKGFKLYLCDMWSSKRKDCPKRALSLSGGGKARPSIVFVVLHLGLKGLRQLQGGAKCLVLGSCNVSNFCP